jgi:TolB-like protein
MEPVGRYFHTGSSQGLRGVVLRLAPVFMRRSALLLKAIYPIKKEIAVMKLRIAMTAALLLVSTSFALAQAPGPTLSSITLNSGTSILGEVRSENAVTAQVFDLTTGDEKTIKIADIKVRTPAIDSTAILRVGLPRFLAWRVKKELNGPATGKIAEVTPSSIYLTLGSKDGIEVGSTLTVFRDEGELKDPDTGDVIGRKRAKLARLEVTEVQDSYSKAKRLGDTDVELKAKDQVEQEGVSLAVAIMPILDIEGDETTTGKTLAEQISTMFVSRGITVVERERLNVALTELALQQSKAFDANAAQKVGKQLGAVAVVTGTITPKAMRAEAHVRLIRVQTGEAIVAASQDLAAIGNKVAGSPQPAVPGAGAAVPKIDPALLRKKFSASKATYDAKTGELSLAYDFKTPLQSKDFDLKESKPNLRGGAVYLDPGDVIDHIAKFESATVSGIVSIPSIESQRTLLSCSGGIELQYSREGGLSQTQFFLLARQQGQKREVAKATSYPWPIRIAPLRFSVIGNKASASVADRPFGGTSQLSEFGTLSIHGGSGGIAIGGLVISGKPNEEWFREFLAK